MEDSAKLIGNVPLRELALPGTHDSATYNLSTKCDYSPDGPQGLRESFIKGHTFTQALPLTVYSLAIYTSDALRLFAFSMTRPLPHPVLPST